MKIAWPTIQTKNLEELTIKSYHKAYQLKNYFQKQ